MVSFLTGFRAPCHRAALAPQTAPGGNVSTLPVRSPWKEAPATKTRPEETPAQKQKQKKESPTKLLGSFLAGSVFTILKSPFTSPTSPWLLICNHPRNDSGERDWQTWINLIALRLGHRGEKKLPPSNQVVQPPKMDEVPSWTGSVSAGARMKAST